MKTKKELAQERLTRQDDTAYAVDLYNHTITGDVTMTLCCERMDPHHMPCVVIVKPDEKHKVRECEK